MKVEVPELCPRFSARVFTDVELGPSPLWLKARLIGAGMRPINNVVDITNYVMLMTAQPLHAFDLDKVPDGALIVRTAKQGEKMTTLDGVERTFDEDAVLVCDRNGPSGIAGIMGGEVSEVSETTTRVLLEVATLERGQHPADLAEARAAHRRVQPLREAAAPGAGAAGAAGRLGADGRALRGEARSRDDRRGGRDPGATPAGAADRARGGPSGNADRAQALLGVSEAARLRRLRQGEDAEGHGPAPPPLRRHPGGRPDRGGRPHPWLRQEPALHVAVDERPGRPADAASSACAGERRMRCATSASTRSSTSASPTPACRGGSGSPARTPGPSRSGSPTRSPPSTPPSARR